MGYEHERGIREVGETADAGYQIGVQRTLPVPKDQLWELLTSPDGLAIWLGEGESFPIEPGQTYNTPRIPPVKYVRSARATDFG